MKNKSLEIKNKELNEGICYCGHHSKDHSYNNTLYSIKIPCDKCKCEDFKFHHFDTERRNKKNGSSSSYNNTATCEKHKRIRPRK